MFAAIEKARGVTATVVGKPEPPLFELARQALHGHAPTAVVGDHLIVGDIHGAKRSGLAALLALSGVTHVQHLGSAPTWFRTISRRSPLS
jgi:4-nitrophenyl phosphatase